MSEDTATGARRGFASRFGAAFLLEPALYDEVEGDPSALFQAGAVVTLGGLSRGLASLPEAGVAGIVAGLLSGWALWLVAAGVVHLVGVRWFGFSSDLRELLRTVGFAAAPLVLLAPCGLPLGPFREGLFGGAHLLAVLALFVSIRQALDVDSPRALLVCALASAVGFLLVALIGLLLAGPAAARIV